jgi:hypothetical protein
MMDVREDGLPKRLRLAPVWVGDRASGSSAIISPSLRLGDGDVVRISGPRLGVGLSLPLESLLLRSS